MKKLASIALTVILLAMTLTACGGEDETLGKTTDKTSGSTENDSAAAEASAKPSPSSASGAEETPEEGTSMPLSGVAKFYTGAGFSMAIKTDGSLWWWGSNNVTKFDIEQSEYRNPIPLHILDNISDVSTSNAHVLFIKTDGSLWGWGQNSDGQLGDGTTEHRSNPVHIMDNVVAVSTGFDHTMAIKTDGSLWGWGQNSEGQLGDGTTINRNTPKHIMDNVSVVSAGGHYTMAIKTDGSLWAWGSNRSGRLGINWSKLMLSEPSINPTHVMDNVVAVSTSDPTASAHTMAITTDGSLWAWGSNGRGQLGDGTKEDRRSPVHIMDNVSSVSAGNTYTTIAVKTDGSLWGWGANSGGNISIDYLGENISDVISLLDPVYIMDNVTAVSTGSGYTMAIKTDGSLWAWGSNSSGQLGNSTVRGSNNPPVQVQIP